MTLQAVPDFASVARDYAPHLQRYLLRQVGNEATANDLLQETLLGISRGLAHFEGRASLKTWVFAIASRVAADYLRRPERSRIIVDMDALLEMEDGETALDDRLEFDDMNQCVREVIDSLPSDYRAALILHDLEDMDCAQTAAVLGISLGAARVRIHRARARLKVALQQQCGFYHDSESVLRCQRQR
jgi:RNA polymerase sigma-70 factor (ECF subfamily)